MPTEKDLHILPSNQKNHIDDDLQATLTNSEACNALIKDAQVQHHFMRIDFTFIYHIFLFTETNQLANAATYSLFIETASAAGRYDLCLEAYKKAGVKKIADIAIISSFMNSICTGYAMDNTNIELEFNNAKTRHSLSTEIYNIFIKNIQDIKKAEAAFNELVKNEKANSATYKIYAKAQLHHGNAHIALQALETAMYKPGADSATYLQCFKLNTYLQNLKHARTLLYRKPFKEKVSAESRQLLRESLNQSIFKEYDKNNFHQAGLFFAQLAEQLALNSKESIKQSITYYLMALYFYKKAKDSFCKAAAHHHIAYRYTDYLIPILVREHKYLKARKTQKMAAKHYSSAGLFYKKAYTQSKYATIEQREKDVDQDKITTRNLIKPARVQNKPCAISLRMI